MRSLALLDIQSAHANGDECANAHRNECADDHRNECADDHRNEYEVSTGKTVLVRVFSLTKKMSIKPAINSMSNHNQL